MSSFTKLLLARVANEHSNGKTPLETLLVLTEMIENQARADERRGGSDAVSNFSGGVTGRGWHPPRLWLP